MKRDIQQTDGRGKDAKITKQFSVLDFPSTFAGVVEAVKDDEGAQATCYTLFCTQFDVFTRGKIKDGEQMIFLDALKVERRAASFNKRREGINAALLQGSLDMASGKIDLEAFQTVVADCKKNLATVDSDEAKKKVKKAKGNAAADEQKS